MSDVDLRALEREVASDGSAGCRLRYAAALERLREDSREEVLLALLPARDDVAVRTKIGRCYPVWNSPEFGSHTPHFIDVPPLEAVPRLRWHNRLSGLNHHSMLLASHLSAHSLRQRFTLTAATAPRSGSFLTRSWVAPSWDSHPFTNGVSTV